MRICWETRVRYWNLLSFYISGASVIPRCRNSLRLPYMTGKNDSVWANNSAMANTNFFREYNWWRYNAIIYRCFATKKIQKFWQAEWNAITHIDVRDTIIFLRRKLWSLTIRTQMKPWKLRPDAVQRTVSPLVQLRILALQYWKSYRPCFMLWSVQDFRVGGWVCVCVCVCSVWMYAWISLVKPSL